MQSKERLQQDCGFDKYSSFKFKVNTSAMTRLYIRCREQTVRKEKNGKEK